MPYGVILDWIEISSRPNVLIIGGGIGGLFAANALIGQGLRVSVYEQASALGEIGAGVFVTPNAVRYLERVGLGPAVERWGARVGPGSYYFRHDGTPIAPVQVSDASGWNATFGMHRADFVGFLAANLPAGIVHCSHRCHRLRADRRRSPRRICQRRHRRGRRCGCRRRNTFRTALLRLSVLEARLSRHHFLSRFGLAGASAELADGPLANVGRSVQAFPGLPYSSAPGLPAASRQRGIAAASFVPSPGDLGNEGWQLLETINAADRGRDCRLDQSGSHENTDAGDHGCPL